GLDGKISCLPSANRNQTGRGAEEEAFHHLHLEPPIVAVEGFRFWWVMDRTPRRPPQSPKAARPSLPENTARIDFGFPPPPHCHIIGRVPTRNEELAGSQARLDDFSNVLRKKHAASP